MQVAAVGLAGRQRHGRPTVAAWQQHTDGLGWLTSTRLPLATA